MPHHKTKRINIIQIACLPSVSEQFFLKETTPYNELRNSNVIEKVQCDCYKQSNSLNYFANSLNVKATYNKK